MTTIQPGEYDAMADVIAAQLDEDDDARADVRYDVEHTPGEIPGEVWRDALNAALRQLAKTRTQTQADRQHHHETMVEAGRELREADAEISRLIHQAERWA